MCVSISVVAILELSLCQISPNLTTMTSQWNIVWLPTASRLQGRMVNWNKCGKSSRCRIWGINVNVTFWIRYDRWSDCTCMIQKFKSRTIFYYCDWLGLMSMSVASLLSRCLEFGNLLHSAMFLYDTIQENNVIIHVKFHFRLGIFNLCHDFLYII